QVAFQRTVSSEALTPIVSWLNSTKLNDRANELCRLAATATGAARSQTIAVAPGAGCAPPPDVHERDHGSLAGLGDAALASRAAAGMLGRHQAEIRHELPGIGEARDVAELSHQSGCGYESHAAQGLQGFNHRCERPLRQHCFDMCLQSVAPCHRCLDGRDTVLQHNMM